MAWIAENMGNILITLILIAIVVGSILSIRKDKKQGKSSCGGNCAHCHMCAVSDREGKYGKSDIRN